MRNGSIASIFSALPPTVYALNRPTYPPQLFTLLAKLAGKNDVAWDVGCGSGQASFALAKHFKRVIGTDPSKNQLASLVSHAENVEFYAGGSEDPLESLNVPFGGVDLITVAQALHWFDFDKFYRNVRRASKKEGSIIAAWTYSLGEFPEPHRETLTKILMKYYNDILGKYFDERRVLIENNYSTIPWPFEPVEIQSAETTTISGFKSTVEWDVRDFLGYLRSWSATQNYINQKISSSKFSNTKLTELFSAEKDYTPLRFIEEELIETWPGIEKDGFGEKIKVSFPITVKIGRSYYKDV